MKKKLIIVEDEKPMIKALTAKLKSEGYEVENASDANEFFQKISKESFDLILLDLMLPGVSGFEILERLKNKGIKTPVIIASNLSQQEDKERVDKLGVSDYIVKSDTSLTEIVNKIKSFLK